MLWREIADFAERNSMALRRIITNRHINISDYSIKKLHMVSSLSITLY